ncbi:MAG: 4-oxalocrotonate tautomerase [Firmicutes bacterium]|nr:4-oxalocrotonate tautomerase [Bacillota bacterium]
MPIIQVDAGPMSKETKAELCAKLTKTAAEILNIPEQAFTVVLRENSGDNISVGGTLLSDRK